MTVWCIILRISAAIAIRLWNSFFITLSGVFGCVCGLECGVTLTFCQLILEWKLHYCSSTPAYWCYGLSLMNAIGTALEAHQPGSDHGARDGDFYSSLSLSWQLSTTRQCVSCLIPWTWTLAKFVYNHLNCTTMLWEHQLVVINMLVGLRKDLIHIAATGSRKTFIIHAYISGGKGLTIHYS